MSLFPRNDSGGGYSDKINASVMSGDLPDVLTVDGPNIAAYASNGIIQPLAKLTEKEKSVYLQSIIDQGTYKDKLYALGAMESSVGLYYNKDILKEAGISIPDADHPWTQSQFLDILAKLKPVMDKKNGYALDMTFPVWGGNHLLLCTVFSGQMAEIWWTRRGLSVDGVFNSKENVKTVSYFQSLLKNKYMSKVPIDHLFESGRAAFKIDGAWEVNTLYTSYQDVSFGVAPYVVGDSWNGERYAPTGSWAFAASSKTKHIKGATELVKWMSGVGQRETLMGKVKIISHPHMKRMKRFDVFQKDENYKALYYQLSNYGHPRPKTPAYPQVSTSFQQVLENCVLSGFDPQEQLDKSVERINAKLKRYTLE